MELRSDDAQALSLIKQSRTLALLTDEHASADTVATLLAFYHLFKSPQRRIDLIVPETVPAECQHLPESSVIRHDLPPKNLIISLDTSGTPLTKISYWQEGATFNLAIHPRQRSFEVEKIRYAYEGDHYDAFVTFGVLRLADLGVLYLQNQKEFSQTPIINFDYRSENEVYGSINLLETNSTQLSEVLFRKMALWQIRPNREVAQSLLTAWSLEPSGADTQNQDLSRPRSNQHASDENLAAERGALVQ